MLIWFHWAELKHWLGAGHVCGHELTREMGKGQATEDCFLVFLYFLLLTLLGEGVIVSSPFETEDCRVESSICLQIQDNNCFTIPWGRWQKKTGATAH